MRIIALMFSMIMLTSYIALAQVPVAVAVPSADAAVAVPVAPIIVAAPEGSVPVAEPAAPPKWSEDIIVSAQKLPVVGPMISKALVFIGALSSILTALVAFLLTTLSALSGVLNVTGLANFADKVKLFKNGKFMYWLSYLSMFNAKKPAQKETELKQQELKQAA